MPCYHPLTRIVSNTLNLDTGKYSGTVVPFIPHDKRLPDVKYQDIPCGQCLGCRLDYSRKWADRLMMESKEYDHVWFVTLTYDDFHLPTSARTDPQTGEVLNFVPTLSKRDVQLFMKNLRKALAPERVRYFCSGEYGDKTFRPHYHLILFGGDLCDLVFYKRSPRGDLYYNSETLSKAWRNKGHVVVSAATYETMLYTSRYVTKKLKGFESVFYKMNGILPPFSVMSRKPGLGANTFSKDLMLYDKIILPEGRRASHPRYFQKLLERDFPDFYDEYKMEREKRNDVRTQILLDSIEVPYLDYLSIQEKNLKSRISVLDSVKQF